MKHILRLFPSD